MHPHATPPPRPAQRIRLRLEVRGRVQGVGFRPHVYRLARGLNLGGVVGNDTHGAFVEIEGPPGAIEAFARRLPAELPPLASITALSRRAIPPRGESAFRIDPSDQTGLQDAEIAPDVATCDDCLAELFDPTDRRYRYPFINCTNCGPRYSIIRAVPYDRPHTTMRRFAMCAACQAEYDDPAHRRFHAQPNACPACGPRLWLADAAGREKPGDPIAAAAALLSEGRILAVKGLGGFHLACRADDDRAVRRLRQRKGREAKPLAVMVDSPETAAALVDLGHAEAVLADPRRPIVLLPARPGAAVSAHVAPSLDRLGIMLPYTPVHHLLLRAGPRTLVMTSGNPTEEPLCCDNAEALRRLGPLADAFLMHDRDIERRVDDSVVLGPDRPGRPPLPVRRARGFAPAPITVPFDAPAPVLAVGGELKSTVCLLAGNQAVVSEHLGELPNAEAYRHFLGTIEQLKRLLKLEPALVAADLHPDYAATRYARSLRLPLVTVQHHHAHLVSVLADNGLSGRVVGIVCDGTGYGPDGAIWGGEVLVGDEMGFERAAHLAYYPLPGGDAGARQTWRPAAGLLSRIDDDFTRLDPASFRRVPPEALDVVRRRLRQPDRLPRTSSLGRLFDAAAFLLGLCDENRFEAEAAMQLEAAAQRAAGADPLPYTLTSGANPREPIRIDAGPTLRALIERRNAGDDTAALARAFHETVATMLADAARQAAGRTALGRVVLSGGCLVNELLRSRLRERLAAAGLEVFEHQQVPPGDGGLALGQAVAAAKRHRATTRGRQTE